MVDETVIGASFVPVFLVDTLRDLRFKAVLPYDVSISMDEKSHSIVINCCEGEAVRPILRVPGLSKLRRLVSRNAHTTHLLFQDLLRENVMVYINKHEEDNYVIASSIQQLYGEGKHKFTHIEIDPSTTLYGASSGLIPWSNFNQGPRVVYFSNMAGQAIGAQSLLLPTQYDVQTHVLGYPQKALSRTLTSEVVEGEEMDESFIQMFNVAVMPYDGLNQEDAVVLNKAAIERGLGASYKITVVRDSENSAGNDKEVIGVVDPSVAVTARKLGSTAAIGPDGLPRVGATVKPGDIIISKVMYVKLQGTKGSSPKKVIDRSTVWKGNGTASIVSVDKHSRCGLLCIAVKLREMHFLDVGDKLSSMAAQKGVISSIVPQEDLPFNQDGIVPDLVIPTFAFLFLFADL
jgi:DNA-directed RNA polymerase subunit B'